MDKVCPVSQNPTPPVGLMKLIDLDDFSTLCFVRADLSPLTSSAKAMTGHGGKKYWTIVFSIEIHFGLTEFKARIKWNDDVCFYFHHFFFVLDILTFACFPGESEIVSTRSGSVSTIE